MIGSVRKIKVRAEHGLLAERGVGDDSMYVEEEARVTACKVRQVSFRHGSDVASDVFGQVLVVVFLTRRACQTQDEKTNVCKVATHLIPKGTEEVLHRSPVVFPELAQVFYKDFV